MTREASHLIGAELNAAGVGRKHGWGKRGPPPQQYDCLRLNTPFSTPGAGRGHQADHRPPATRRRAPAQTPSPAQQRHRPIQPAGLASQSRQPLLPAPGSTSASARRPAGDRSPRAPARWWDGCGPNPAPASRAAGSSAGLTAVREDQSRTAERARSAVPSCCDRARSVGSASGGHRSGPAAAHSPPRAGHGPDQPAEPSAPAD